MFLESAQSYQIVIIALSLGLGLMVIGYFPLLQWIFKSRKQTFQREQGTLQKASQVLEEAGMTAEELLNQAQEKSKELLDRTINTDDKLNTAIQQIYSSELESLRQDLAAIHQEVLKNYSQSIQAVQTGELHQMKDLESVLEDQTAKLLTEIKTKVEADLTAYTEKYQKEIETTNLALRDTLENYQKHQIERAKEQIFTIISDISRETIGRSLTLTDQRELVLRSFDNLTS